MNKRRFILSQKNLRTVVLICAGLVTTFHLATLMRFPAPFVDEVWYLSRAWAFIQTGQPVGQLDLGVIERFDGYWTYLPRIPTVLHALSLRLFDSPALQPLRFTSFMFGSLLLVGIFSIGKSIRDWKLGLVGSLLTAFSWSFIYSSHLARTDIMVAALGVFAIAIHLHNRQRKSFYLGLISGLLVGIAYEFHPNSIIFGFPLLVFYFYDNHWGMFTQRHFWGFALGIIVSLVAYAGLHILPYPDTYIALSRILFTETHLPPLFTLELSAILQSFLDEGHMLFATYQPAIIIMIVAVYDLWRRRGENERLLFILVVAVTLAHTLLVRNKFLYYAILITPMLDIALANFLIDFLRRSWRSRIAYVLIQGLVWGLLIGGLLLNLSVARFDFWQDYLMAQEGINAVIQTGDHVLGPQTYWLGLHENPYFSWEDVVYYRRMHPGTDLVDGLAEFRPDILIIDKFVSWFIADLDEGGDRYLESLRLPKAELESFLESRALLITQFDGRYYGDIRVYRIHW